MKRLPLYIAFSCICCSLFGQKDSLARGEIGFVIAPFISWQSTDLINEPLGNTNGISMGVVLNKNITRRISVEPGLLYTYYNGLLICDSIGPLPDSMINGYHCFGSRNEQLHILKLPLVVDFALLKKAKFSLHGMAGIQYELLMKKWSRLNTEYRTYYQYATHNLGYRIAIGMEYYLTDNVVLKSRIIGETINKYAISSGLVMIMSFNI